MCPNNERQPSPIYKDFNDWWANGRHGWTSASVDIAKATWEDFEPTINASRDEYTELMLREVREMHEHHVEHLVNMHAYLKEHNLEAVAGVKFYRWLLDRETGRNPRPKISRYVYKGSKYAVTGKTMLKHPTTGEWVDAYQYINCEEPLTTYTRIKTDFDQKFELCDD